MNSNGQWQCQACLQHVPVDLKRIKGHEAGSKHTKNVERYDARQTNVASGSQSSPVPHSVPMQHVRGALGRTLAQLQSQAVSQEDYVNLNTGVVDWSSADYVTQLDDSYEVRMTSQLAQNLADYLEGDYDPGSDDEVEERSQLDDSSDSDSGQFSHSISHMLD